MKMQKKTKILETISIVVGKTVSKFQDTYNMCNFMHLNKRFMAPENIPRAHTERVL